MTSPYIGFRVKFGDRVVWLRDQPKPNEAGIVKWIGVIDDEQIAGIEFDRPLGLGSGWYNNRPLFDCAAEHGGLISLSLLILEKDLNYTPSRKGTLSPGGDVVSVDKYANLLKTGQFSDLTITVKERNGTWTEIKVHKAILAAGSAVFQKILESPTMRQATNGSVIISELSPSCVRSMLQYIYTGKLDESWKFVGDELVKAGDKYGIPGLLDFLDRNLHLTCTLENAMKLRHVAKSFDLNLAARKINAFIVSNIDKIPA